MNRAQIVLAPLCACIALTISASAHAAEKPAQPQTRQQQEKAWHAIAKLPDFWQGTWQSIGAIADDFPVSPDYTPAALEQIRTFKPTEDSPFANCTPLGLPFAQSIGGMPMKFFQSPGMIALYIESSGMTRFIHTDGRAHNNPPNPSYLGESIGHWEGDTLVVDSTGFEDGTLFQIGRDRRPLLGGDPNPMAGVIFGKHGPNMRLVERMRLVDLKTLEIQTTVHDDTVFKKPYALPPRKFLRGIERRNEPQEWACTDNRDFLDPETGKLELNVKSKAQSR
jgi:hypothetical protein